MTRRHNQIFECPNCRTQFSAETCFGRWIRANERLDSESGFSVVDCDYWVHRFRTEYGRDFQCIMLIEVKTYDSQLRMAQKDTLHLANQLMRNRRGTPTKEKLFEASGNGPLEVFSVAKGGMVSVKHFGVQVLRFSGLGPDDSEKIWWNKTQITEEQLTGLLRFDLDPDTLRPLDLRLHHAKPEQALLKRAEEWLL